MDNQNSVAFISRISEITPIEGADRIQQAKVEGWNSIIQKGSLSVGDLVICLTTDAVIPEEYAKENNIDTYLRKGFRVRTVKLKGVYSECILLKAEGSYKIGQCVQGELGVYKYEPPVLEVVTVGGKKLKKSVNPHFYVYHKFPNAKNVPDMFTEGDDVQITRKIHGSNFRASVSKKHKLSLIDKIWLLFGNKKRKYEFCYGSRTVQKHVKSKDKGFYGKDYWLEMVEKYDVEKRLWELVEAYGIDKIGEGVVIYGEVFGEGVQGDKYTYGVKGRDLKLFDITIDGEYQDGYDKWSFFSIMSLPHVEILYTGPYNKTIVDEYLDMNIEGTKTPHEGVVVTHISGDRSKIAKFINPAYLTFSEKWAVPDSH